MILLIISVQFNESSTKGKQMLPGGSKTRSALQTGYFQDKFGRILEGEAFSDPIKIRRQSRLKEAQKNIGKAFLPSSGEKKMYICPTFTLFPFFIFAFFTTNLVLLYFCIYI
jgi:hypothetical protein